MKKIIFSLLLALCMFNNIQAQNFTYSTIEGVELKFYIGTQSATVAGISSSALTFDEITIPSEVSYNGNDYPVKTIGMNAFEDCSGLKSIIIPNSIVTIGSYAFQGCI